jgi:hypothetical protein
MKGFDRLDLDTKSIMLYYNGTLITSVRYYNYKVTLYALDNELIEQYYDTETKEITQISMTTDHDLKKYLVLIDISDLYQKSV